MQRIDELDLYTLPMSQAIMAEDPMSQIDKAREKHPWLAKSDMFGYVITEYAAMRELFGQDDKMRPPYADAIEELGQVGTPWGRFSQEQMLVLPDDVHALLRGALAARFTPRYANQLRPMMRQTIGRLLDDWAPRERIDFEEFASLFPVSVMFAMLGAPMEGIDLLRDDLHAVGLAISYDPERFPRVNQGILNMEAFCVKCLADRRAHPRTDGVEDLLELLMRTAEENGLTDRQLIDMMIFFFIAGYDTSKNVLTFAMYTLLSHPEVYERCAEDYDFCRKVIEETLRIFNPSNIGRVPREDLVYRNVLIPKDTILFFPLSISGRDRQTFADGEAFDPARPIVAEHRHLAFGLGKHMCLGQYIARAQLQEAIHQIARRMRNPRLVGDVEWRPFVGAWGLESLPIEFTPGEAKVEEFEVA